MEKKLYRNMENKMLTGVCSGLADYFELDPTLVRVLAVIGGIVMCVPVVVAYAIISFVVPEKPDGEEAKEEIKEEAPVEE